MIGLSLGLAYVLPKGSWRYAWSAFREKWGLLAATLFLSGSPDLDLLPGLWVGNLNAFHHAYTHTLGWVFLMSAGVYLCWRSFHPEDGWRCFVLFFLAALSHLGIDYLTEDTSYPYGVMAFWPFQSDYFLFNRSYFLGPEKANVAALFQWHNVKVMIVDFLVCLPILLAVLVWKWALKQRGRRWKWSS
ncbi:MAG: hypothetical protein A2X46_11675 [Lentisphaerae bacterium GWF2_57_35]|nr:MAG: hypothetical protein A2X46_11675 [Lentisphaerae bacterium GWF2_57_35]